MSRLAAAVLGISLLWAAPVAAQDSLALLVRMEARLDSLRRAAARADSLGYTSSATDYCHRGRNPHRHLGCAPPLR